MKYERKKFRQSIWNDRWSIFYYSLAILLYLWTSFIHSFSSVFSFVLDFSQTVFTHFTTLLWTFLGKWSELIALNALTEINNVFFMFQQKIFVYLNMSIFYYIFSGCPFAVGHELLIIPFCHDSGCCQRMTTGLSYTRIKIAKLFTKTIYNWTSSSNNYTF